MLGPQGKGPLFTFQKGPFQQHRSALLRSVSTAESFNWLSANICEPDRGPFLCCALFRRVRTRAAHVDAHHENAQSCPELVPVFYSLLIDTVQTRLYRFLLETKIAGPEQPDFHQGLSRVCY